MDETQPQTDEQGRPEPPLSADELGTLRGFLDFQRATLEWKTRGVDDAALRARLHPTSMTLGGLLSHLAWVEDYWFTEVAARSAMPAPWDAADWDADGDWEWTRAGTLGGAELRAQWAESVARSRAVLDHALTDGPDALGATHPAWGGAAAVSLRWILVHMVEEYARHNGHADLLREAVDGEVGE